MSILQEMIALSFATFENFEEFWKNQKFYFDL